MRSLLNRSDLAPGTYDLWQLAPKNKDDRPVKASISHYFTDPGSEDFKMRAFVFGNESARISGRVTVNQDGSKTFHGVEIQPFDTNFDFQHNTLNPLVESPRELARRKYDPENQGSKYDIQYRGPESIHGTGRIYDTFTDAQLNAALREESAYPGSAPSGLLPSVTGKPPLPLLAEHRQYLDQTDGAQASAFDAGPSTARFVPAVDRNSSSADIGNWTSSPAGSLPRNSNQVLQLAEPGRPLGIVTGKPMPPWTAPPPLGGLRDRSDASGNGNWFMPPGAVPDGIGYVIDGRAPAAPVSPLDNPYPVGDVASRLAALTGVDRRNPTQPLQPPLDNDLRGYYRDHPAQPWLLQGRR